VPPVSNSQEPAPKWRSDVAEDVLRQRIYWAAIPAGFFFGMIFGAMTGHLFLGMILGPIIMTIVGFGVYRVMVIGMGDAVGGMVVPDTRGRAGLPYSHIEALEAKGDITGAIAAWEAACIAHPDAVVPVMSGADLYARKGDNPVRAAELFRELQSHEHANDETRRYASQRLIDLYLGALNDEGRALVELRRFAERWPNTPEGRGALKAIADIKRTRQA
jgi:hypothetical protein